MTQEIDPAALRRHGGAFRRLWSFDRAAYAAHLRRLSPEDRRARFHHAVGDAWIDAHAARAVDGRGLALGWFCDGALRAASEVALTADGAAAEAAFDVEAGWRGGGSQLVARALLWARNRGARRLLIQTTRGNVAMLTVATRHGATFSFDLGEAEGVIEAAGPTLRSHMQEATLAQEGARRLAEQARARLRALLIPAPTAPARLRDAGPAGIGGGADAGG